MKIFCIGGTIFFIFIEVSCERLHSFFISSFFIIFIFNLIYYNNIYVNNFICYYIFYI